MTVVALRANRLAQAIRRTAVETVPSATVRGVLALVATGLLWGLVVVGPELVPDASATSIVGGRFVVLGLVAAVAGRGRRANVDWPRAFRYAATGFVGYYLLLVLGVQRAGAAPVAVVLGLSPVLYGLLGARAERLDVRRLAAPLGVIAVGIGLTHAVDLVGLGGRGAGDLVLGLVLALAATVVWLWYGLDNGAYVRASGVSSATWTSAVGLAAGVLGAPLLVHGLAVGGVGSSSLRWLGVVGVLGFGSAWLGTVAWNAANRLLPDSVLGPLLVIEVLISLGYAHLLEHSLPGPITGLGYVLLTVGVAATMLRLDHIKRAA